MLKTVTFKLSMVKMPLKGEVGGCTLNDHGNYIVDHGKSWKNHGILFLNFCGNPVICMDIYTFVCIMTILTFFTPEMKFQSNPNVI